MRLGSSRSSQVAPSLVLPYPALEKAGLRLRRGQTSLTVAAPGVGKSQLWANLAYRMRVPTLYWSADTDQTDVTIRQLALITGEKTDLIEQRLQEESWHEYLIGQLKTVRHIDWVFDSAITGRGVRERLDAFCELHGQYPWLVVLDNMSNAIQNPAEEYAQIKTMQTETQHLAREVNAHIAVLHHAKGEYDSGQKPIPQSGGLQNPFKIPEVGLTLFSKEGQIGVCVVKNRGGKADPGAQNPVMLPIDFSRSAVLGHKAAA